MLVVTTCGRMGPGLAELETRDNIAKWFICIKMVSHPLLIKLSRKVNSFTKTNVLSDHLIERHKSQTLKSCCLVFRRIKVVSVVMLQRL